MKVEKRLNINKLLIEWYEDIANLCGGDMDGVRGAYSAKQEPLLEYARKLYEAREGITIAYCKKCGKVAEVCADGEYPYSGDYGPLCQKCLNWQPLEGPPANLREWW